MQRIIVTGATSMIGVALIEECIKHGTEVYAVERQSWHPDIWQGCFARNWE